MAEYLLLPTTSYARALTEYVPDGRFAPDGKFVFRFQVTLIPLSGVTVFAWMVR